MFLKFVAFISKHKRDLATDFKVPNKISWEGPQKITPLRVLRLPVS